MLEFVSLLQSRLGLAAVRDWRTQFEPLLDNWRSVDPQKVDPTDNAGVHGILTFCFEMGRSFQPSPSQIPAVTGAASKGTQVFIDEVLARSHS